jgi:hypothetical protein
MIDIENMTALEALECSKKALDDRCLKCRYYQQFSKLRENKLYWNCCFKEATNELPQGV